MTNAPLRWNTRFGRWVSRYRVSRLTVDLAARGVPVTPHAVYDWIAARRAPRPTCAAAIVEISGGKLSFDDIYRHRAEIAARLSDPHA